MTAAELVARARALGYRVGLDTDTGAPFVQSAPGTPDLPPDLPPELRAALRRNRVAVIEYLTVSQCRTCGRECDGEDRARLAGINPLCDVVKCPYRQRVRT